ncbi:MAG: NUDIX hydrolase [Deltaproteobacteria bacterium]|nr:NUDIX hydrolase [Deltaproteobacteria bacterium]
MRVVDSKHIYAGWPPITQDTVEFCDGTQKKWIAVHFGEGVAVLALTSERKVILTTQHLLGALEPVYVLPGGVVHRGESLEAAAKRELLEETGYVAGRLEPLFRYNNMPAFSRGWVHLFLAENVTPIPHTPDPNEITGVELLDLAQAVEMAVRGDLKTSSTTMGVLLLQQRLGNGRRDT